MMAADNRPHCVYCGYAYRRDDVELPEMVTHVRRCPMAPDQAKLGVVSEALDVADRIGLAFKRDRDYLLAACRSVETELEQRAMSWEDAAPMLASTLYGLRDELRAAIQQATSEAR